MEKISDQFLSAGGGVQRGEDGEDEGDVVNGLGAPTRVQRFLVFMGNYQMTGNEIN